MNSFLKYTLYIVLIIVWCSCKKLVEVQSPTNRLTRDVVFESDKSATSAIYGLYSRMMQSNLSLLSSGLTIFPALSADELVNTTAGSYDEFSKNSLLASNNFIQNNLWASAYNYIYQANAILEGVEQSEKVSAPVKNQLAGEAKFIRAFCYFYLVNLFGDVPKVVTTDFEMNVNLSRLPVAEIYTLIIQDLKSAQTLLVASYPSSGRVRPNRWTATALLARVYLFLKDYEKVETEASAVINSGTYSLVANINNVFLSTSNEAIWQLVPVQPNNNTWEGNTFIPVANQIPLFAVDSSVLKAYDLADLRKTAWIKSVSIGSSTYHYPFKYKVKTAATITEHLIVIRLAEVLLARAEARANLENIAGAQADLNQIRSRAGLGNALATTKSTLLNAIEKERQLELFAEWGHRWFDLKRTGNANQYLSVHKSPNWQSTAQLYPIPSVEIQKNSLLLQNPGY